MASIASEIKRNSNNNSELSLLNESKKLQKEGKIDKNKITIVPFKNVFLKIYKDNHYYILDRYR